MLLSSIAVLATASFFPFSHVNTSKRVSSAAMRRRLSIFLTFVLVAIFALFALQYMPSGEAKVSSRRSKQAILQQFNQMNTASSSWVPPLRTAGRDIVDVNGRRFKLASANWYGASDIMYVPMGLDVRHRNEIATTIRKMGFNSVRFPYSDQMVLDNPVVDPADIAANLDLLERADLDDSNKLEDMQVPRALDVYKACVEAMTEAGLAVIINNHITNAHWCDGKNLCDASWKNDHYGPICKIHQTTQSWIDNWRTIMKPFINNPLVIGADLRNEPRGLWGTMTWSMWASAAEKASEALLLMQPNWLMFVEGISSANDCSGARKRPIKLSIPGRVVYSSHVYKWSGWSTLVPYSKRSYASFATDMERNWGYLINENIAPVWVGEFGITSRAEEGDMNYWNHLMEYLEDVDADWGYWAINPHKPETYGNETYGLLSDDWETPHQDFRLDDLRRLMT
jgi:endoglucanase